MSLTTRIAEDMKTAMKAGDKTTLETLRSLRAAILEIEKQKIGTTLSEDDDLTILNAAAKKRREAADAFRDAGHADRSERETSEGKVITEYLPEQLSEDEVKKIIADAIAETGAAGPSGMGLVMKAIQPKVAGKADGGTVSGLVKAALTGGN